MFPINITEKGLSSGYILSKNFKRKKDHLIFLNGQYDRNFTNGNIQADRHMKRCLTLLVNREIQNNTMIRYNKKA